MSPRVDYQLHGGIAEIRMDDGKVNALSLEMLVELGGAFDRAKADRAAVVLSGRPGVFSAGFDLRVLRAGGSEANAMVRTGDYRIGAQGAHRIGANEVAIGIAMPYFGVEICRQRLAPAHFQRAVALAEMYAPDDAVAAGFLDRVVPAAEVERTAREVAAQLAALPREV